MDVLETTLLIAIKDNKVLLAEKKRGFGAGKINGAGGKIEPGETIAQAMVRETREEIGITPTSYKKRGIIEFDAFYKNGEPKNIRMHIFVADKFEGTPKESDEMNPIWFDVDKIPFERMFEDDILWFKELLAGNNFRGKFKFDKNFKLLSQELKVVEEELDR